jgi:hypothetical protein
VLLSAFCQVSRTTLSDRFHGKHKARDGNRQLLLTTSQETVLVDWCEHQSKTAVPLNPGDLRSIAYSISGTLPGKTWHRRFERRHPELKLSIPSSLDPKRAQNFNKAAISHYFELCQKIKDDHPDLPPEHMWNMDEKGIQMGGGRKNSCQKFYHLRSLKKKNLYRIRLDNLELVTIAECILAAGALMPPAFILVDGPMPDCTSLDGIGR